MEGGQNYGTSVGSDMRRYDKLYISIEAKRIPQKETKRVSIPEKVELFLQSAIDTSTTEIGKKKQTQTLPTHLQRSGGMPQADQVKRTAYHNI